MANLTRAQILARKVGKGVATLPDGSTVAIRALTRDEVLAAQEGSGSTAERDTILVATAMTDPKLSVEDVASWAASGAAGDIVAVSEAIQELSGLKPGAEKAAYKSLPDEPGTGV